MWHYKCRWKYGPHKADMNTHADTTIPSRRNCGQVGEGTSGKVLNWTVCSLNHLNHTQDLSMGSQIFDLVTLTLKFNLLLKKVNLGHSFLTRRGRTFICTFLVARPLHGYQHFLPIDLDLEVLPTFKKTFNLGLSFLARRGRAFTLHMYIPSDKTFP